MNVKNKAMLMGLSIRKAECDDYTLNPCKKCLKNVGTVTTI